MALLTYTRLETRMSVLSGGKVKHQRKLTHTGLANSLSLVPSTASGGLKTELLTLNSIVSLELSARKPLRRLLYVDGQGSMVCILVVALKAVVVDTALLLLRVNAEKTRVAKQLLVLGVNSKIAHCVQVKNSASHLRGKSLTGKIQSSVKLLLPQ